MHAMEISRTGLDVEWRRLEVIAQNIANANSVQAGGEPYRAMRLLTGPRGAFESLVDGAGGGELRGVAAYGLEPVQAPPRRVYEPGHPQADANGFVTYAGLDQAAEMTLMVRTARAYEANIVALTAARQMYVKAMEIGRRT